GTFRSIIALFRLWRIASPPHNPAPSLHATLPKFIKQDPHLQARSRSAPARPHKNKRSTTDEHFATRTPAAARPVGHDLRPPRVRRRPRWFHGGRQGHPQP